MEYEWDTVKARSNLRKHGIAFADAVLALEDPRALTMTDPDSSGEQRFVSLGLDAMARVLVAVFAPRGRRTRVISSRRASRSERQAYENR